MTQSKHKKALLVVFGIALFLGVGIAIPKLTVHDTVPAEADRSCVEQVLNKPIKKLSWEWIVRATGQTQVVSADVTHGDVKFYTLFRIPLDLNISINCLWAGTPNPIISAAQVPEGWYEHVLAPPTNAPEVLKYIVLTKHKDLPQRNAGDAPYDTPQITVTETKLNVSPEQTIKQLGLANENAEATGLPVGRWTTYAGHKMFTITLEIGGDAVMIFGGDRMYTFTLIGESQDRNDLWRVINYYVQNSSFPVISRAETLATCKTVNLPPGQEYDIMGDTETGYVTIGYWPNSSPGMGTQETYAFLNYNDDLSQCTPSIKQELERTKINGEKMSQ